MAVERLREVLTDLSTTLNSLQRQINEANQLLETVSLAPTESTSPTVRSASASSSRAPGLERRVEELETDNRNLTGNLEQLLARHGICEAEINHAVRAREGMMKKYRLLVRVAADLLQNMMEGFPEDEFDDEMLGALLADLRRRIRSPSASTSSSSATARPRSRRSRRSSGTPIHSPEGHGPQVGPESPSTGMDYTTSGESQLSTLTEGLAGPDGTIIDWGIHWGSKCPACIKVTAGPFVQRDFFRIGVDRAMLEDLFHGLIYSTDVTIRLAMSPPESPPPGLPNVRIVFLYDPFYLESENGTYIFDWVTPTGNQAIVNWLRHSDDGDRNPVFHTFTFSKKKNRWYYFGAVRWTLAWNSLNIWPTLEPETRTAILQHLSDRSNGTVTPEEIEERIDTLQLQELSIKITQAEEQVHMEEIAARLGKSPREVRFKRPPVVRGEQ